MEPFSLTWDWGAVCDSNSSARACGCDVGPRTAKSPGSATMFIRCSHCSRLSARPDCSSVSVVQLEPGVSRANVARSSCGNKNHASNVVCSSETAFHPTTSAWYRGGSLHVFPSSFRRSLWQLFAALEHCRQQQCEGGSKRSASDEPPGHLPPGEGAHALCRQGIR